MHMQSKEEIYTFFEILLKWIYIVVIWTVKHMHRDGVQMFVLGDIKMLRELKQTNKSTTDTSFPQFLHPCTTFNFSLPKYFV